MKSRLMLYSLVMAVMIAGPFNNPKITQIIPYANAAEAESCIGNEMDDCLITCKSTCPADAWGSPVAISVFEIKCNGCCKNECSGAKCDCIEMMS